jgi:tetratricopeptide (TPR) repeat protein
MLSESATNAQAGGPVDDARIRRTQAMALVVQGALNLRKGEFERGQEEIRKAESILEGLDAPNERIVILPQLGLVAMLTRDYVTAQRVIEEALTLAQRESQIWGQAISLNFLGLLKLIQGQPEDARDLLNDSVSWWSKQKGLTYGKVRSLVHLGVAHHALGDYEKAQSIQEEALHLAQKTKDYSFLPLSQCNLAFHHYAQGKLGLAKAGFRTGLAEAKRFELLNFVWYGILGLGLVAAAEGYTRRAVTLLTFGLDRPGGYTGFLLGEPQRVLSDLRNSLSFTDFTAAEEKARGMELADLMAWL